MPLIDFAAPSSSKRTSQPLHVPAAVDCHTHHCLICWSVKQMQDAAATGFASLGIKSHLGMYVDAVQYDEDDLAFIAKKKEVCWIARSYNYSNYIILSRATFTAAGMTAAITALQLHRLCQF
jgi:hypothetical protein